MHWFVGFLRGASERLSPEADAASILDVLALPYSVRRAGDDARTAEGGSPASPYIWIIHFDRRGMR